MLGEEILYLEQEELSRLRDAAALAGQAEMSGGLGADEEVAGRLGTDPGGHGAGSGAAGRADVGGPKGVGVGGDGILADVAEDGGAQIATGVGTSGTAAPSSSVDGRFLHPHRRDEGGDLLDGLGLEEQPEVVADDGVEAGVVPHGLGGTFIFVPIGTLLANKVGREHIDGVDGALDDAQLGIDDEEGAAGLDAVDDVDRLPLALQRNVLLRVVRLLLGGGRRQRIRHRQRRRRHDLIRFACLVVSPVLSCFLIRQC